MKLALSDAQTQMFSIKNHSLKNPTIPEERQTANLLNHRSPKLVD